MNSAEFFRKKAIFWLRFIGIPIAAILFYLLFFWSLPDEYLYLAPLIEGWPIWTNYVLDVVVTIIASVLISELILCLMFALEHIISWKRHPVWRLMVQLMATVVLSYIVVYVCFYLTPTAPSKADQSALFGDFVFYSFILGLGFNGVFIGVMLFEEWIASSLEAQELKAQTAKAQFEALKAQIDPHFLFNSFNTLVSLIATDTDKATAFVEQMSRVYRYVLETRSQDTVPLAEEMAIAQDYIQMLKIRHGDRIHIELPREPWPTVLLAPMTLQLLLENAVKHNGFSAAKPLVIKVEIAENTLIVSNPITPRTSKEASTGMGLENLSDRYHKLSPNNLTYTHDGHVFCVNVPLLA